jgi:hypothetical protein
MSEKAGVSLFNKEMRILLAHFYADNILVPLRDLNLMQRAFDLLPDLFDRVGSCTNANKMEAVTFLPGKIHTFLAKEGYLVWIDE